MRSMLIAIVISALVTVGSAALMPAHAATLSIACGALGRELQMCREGVETWARQTGHSVRIVPTPNSATERLALYQQMLAARSADIDVFQIDVIWPGILASHFVDLAEHIDAEDVAQHFPAIVDNNTVAGALVAMPWFTDAGVLYYRSDLLAKYGEPVPTTWQALTVIARRIQRAERAAGNARMHGFVFQAMGYEGLSCNALEWIDSFGGGTIIAGDGAITVNNARAAEALALAASWIGDIAPEGVLNYDEEQSRGVFQSGNAVFMRNWPYAWALANAPDSAVHGKVGVAALPKGGEHGRHSSTLGGWQLAVSKYSARPELAADLVRHLTSADEQKRRAIAGAYNPTIPALYEDAEVLEAVPFLAQLSDTFAGAVARPSAVMGARYNRASAAFYQGVHEILSGRIDAERGLVALERRLARISRGAR